MKEFRGQGAQGAENFKGINASLCEVNSSCQTSAAYSCTPAVPPIYENVGGKTITSSARTLQQQPGTTPANSARIPGGIPDFRTGNTRQGGSIQFEKVSRQEQ